MDTKLMFSATTDNWSTPDVKYKELDDEFHFNMDPCPLRAEGGLDKDWIGNIFINPPYSNVGAFLAKGRDELKKGNAKLRVYLLAVRTDTKWFHEYIYKKSAVEIRFIKGRLKFGDSKNSAPFPSMVVIIK